MASVKCSTAASIAASSTMSITPASTRAPAGAARPSVRAAARAAVASAGRSRQRCPTRAASRTARRRRPAAPGRAARAAPPRPGCAGARRPPGRAAAMPGRPTTARVAADEGPRLGAGRSRDARRIGGRLPHRQRSPRRRGRGDQRRVVEPGNGLVEQRQVEAVGPRARLRPARGPASAPMRRRRPSATGPASGPSASLARCRTGPPPATAPGASEKSYPQFRQRSGLSKLMYWHLGHFIAGRPRRRGPGERAGGGSAPRREQHALDLRPEPVCIGPAGIADADAVEQRQRLVQVPAAEQRRRALDDQVRRGAGTGSGGVRRPAGCPPAEAPLPWPPNRRTAARRAPGPRPPPGRPP